MLACTSGWSVTNQPFRKTMLGSSLNGGNLSQIYALPCPPGFDQSWLNSSGALAGAYINGHTCVFIQVFVRQEVLLSKENWARFSFQGVKGRYTLPGRTWQVKRRSRRAKKFRKVVLQAKLG
jgi:hypothetical protein